MAPRMPEQARTSLETIENTGREALTEMRRLLGILREGDEGAALAPQPTLAGVQTLVERARAAGLPVELRIEGDAHQLAPAVDRAAYRVVQEGLTNALKHAGHARVRVVVRYGAQDLELEVSDDGVGPGDGAGHGHGLVGMRERVGLYGGELHVGRRRGGGFVLRARLPREPAAA